MDWEYEYGSAPWKNADGRLSREPKPYKDGPLPPVPADLIAHVTAPSDPRNEPHDAGGVSSARWLAACSTTSRMR